MIRKIETADDTATPRHLVGGVGGQWGSGVVTDRGVRLVGLVEVVGLVRLGRVGLVEWAVGRWSMGGDNGDSGGDGGGDDGGGDGGGGDLKALHAVHHRAWIGYACMLAYFAVC